jgi:hypothetical protein
MVQTPSQKEATEKNKGENIEISASLLGGIKGFHPKLHTILGGRVDRLANSVGIGGWGVKKTHPFFRRLLLEPSFKGLILLKPSPVVAGYLNSGYPSDGIVDSFGMM